MSADQCVMKFIVKSLSKKYPEFKNSLIEIYDKSLLNRIYSENKTWEIGYGIDIVNFHYSLKSISFPEDSREFKLLRS